MAEILPIRYKTLSNKSINQSIKQPKNMLYGFRIFITKSKAIRSDNVELFKAIFNRKNIAKNSVL